MKIEDCTRTKGGYEVEILKVVDGLAIGTIKLSPISKIYLAKWLADTGRTIFVEDLRPDDKIRLYDLDLREDCDTGSLWTHCFFEIMAKAKEKGESVVDFGEVDRLVVEKSHSIVSWEDENEPPADWRKAVASRP